MPFVAATLYLVVVFAWALSKQQIRSGVISYAIVTAICAFGLLRMTTWGRALALVAAVGIAGIGVLSLVSVILAGGNLLGAGVMMGAGFASAAWLARPVFTLPRERDG